jgi:hypothetical protein
MVKSLFHARCFGVPGGIAAGAGLLDGKRNSRESFYAPMRYSFAMRARAERDFPTPLFTMQTKPVFGWTLSFAKMALLRSRSYRPPRYATFAPPIATTMLIPWDRRK